MDMRSSIGPMGVIAAAAALVLGAGAAAAQVAVEGDGNGAAQYTPFGPAGAGVPGELLTTSLGAPVNFLGVGAPLEITLSFILDLANTPMGDAVLKVTDPGATPAASDDLLALTGYAALGAPVFDGDSFTLNFVVDGGYAAPSFSPVVTALIYSDDIPWGTAFGPDYFLSARDDVKVVLNPATEGEIPLPAAAPLLLAGLAAAGALRLRRG